MQKTDVNTALVIVLVASALVLIGGLAIVPTTMQSAFAAGQGGGCGAGGCGGAFKDSFDDSGFTGGFGGGGGLGEGSKKVPCNGAGFGGGGLEEGGGSGAGFSFCPDLRP